MAARDEELEAELPPEPPEFQRLMALVEERRRELVGGYLADHPQQPATQGDQELPYRANDVGPFAELEPMIDAVARALGAPGLLPVSVTPEAAAERSWGDHTGSHGHMQSALSQQSVGQPAASAAALLADGAEASTTAGRDDADSSFRRLSWHEMVQTTPPELLRMIEQAAATLSAAATADSRP